MTGETEKHLRRRSCSLLCPQPLEQCPAHSRCTVAACGLSISPGPGSVLRALSVRCRGKEASPHPAGEQAGLGEVTEGKQED